MVFKNAKNVFYFFHPDPAFFCFSHISSITFSLLSPPQPPCLPVTRTRHHLAASANEVAAPPIFPLGSPSLAARAQATIPPLAPIKAPLEAPKLVAPSTNSSEQSLAHGHTTPRPTLSGRTNLNYTGSGTQVLF
jgi:hypothetical protein